MANKIISGSAKGAKAVVNVYKPSTWKEKGWVWRISLVIITLVIINCGLMYLWSVEPSSISVDEAVQKYKPKSIEVVVKKTANRNSLTTDVKSNNANIAEKTANQNNDKSTVENSKGEQIVDNFSKSVSVVKTYKYGVPTTSATLFILDTLLNKRGGYLSNDIASPAIFMDDMPNWEYGVLWNLRDLSRVYSNYFSKSGSQSTKSQALMDFENNISYDAKKWIFPSTESSYEKAFKGLSKYLAEISDDSAQNAQFYARSDNLKNYLKVMSANLGSISQVLGESVGSAQVNTSLSGDANARQTTEAPTYFYKKTPWMQIDNNFYVARGYCWALLIELRAIQVDFKTVLSEKKAEPYLEKIILELEPTQSTIWSPIILNGSGFGMFANHSLVMAGSIARANATIIDLINLLPEKG